MIRCGMLLIQKLCYETGAETVKMSIDMTHKRKPIGTYTITIEKK